LSGSIIDRGRITVLDGDQAHVEILTGEACAGCGARVLCKPGANNSNILIAFNQAGGQVGDRVEIRESGNILLKLSLLQYVPPLLGFVLGVLVGYLLSGEQNELILFLAGCVGFSVGALITWLGMRAMARNRQHFLIITRIVN